MKKIERVQSFVDLNELLNKFKAMDIQEKVGGKFCNVGKFNSILCLHTGLNINLFKKICFAELKEDKDELFLLNLINDYLEKSLFDINKIRKIIISLYKKGFTLTDIEDLRFTLIERNVKLCDKFSLVDFLTKLNELSKDPSGLEIIRYELLVENGIKELKHMNFKDVMSLLTLDKFFELKDTNAYRVKYLAQNLLLVEKSFKQAQADFLAK